MLWVAWSGWTPVAFSEVEAFSSAVLKHHYPDVPNLGDMTNYKEWDIGELESLTIAAFTPSIDPAFDGFGELIRQVVEIQVNPIDDEFIDRLGGSETITLTLREGANANYTVGTSLETTEISLTGTIQDNLDEISQLTIVGVTSAATINGAAVLEKLTALGAESLPSRQVFTHWEKIRREDRQNPRVSPSPWDRPRAS